MPWTLTRAELDSEDIRASTDSWKSSLAESLMAEEDKRILDLLNSGAFKGSMSASRPAGLRLDFLDATGMPDAYDAASGDVVDLKTVGRFHIFQVEPSRLGVRCMGDGCLFCADRIRVIQLQGAHDVTPISDEFTRSIKDQIKKLTDSIPKPVEKPVKSLFGLFAMATAFGVDVPRELDRAFGKPDHRDPSVERKPGAKANAEAKRAKRSAKRRGGA